MLKQIVTITIIFSILLNSSFVFAGQGKNNLDVIQRARRSESLQWKKGDKNLGLNPATPVMNKRGSERLKPCTTSTVLTCLMLFATISLTYSSPTHDSNTNSTVAACRLQDNCTQYSDIEKLASDQAKIVSLLSPTRLPLTSTYDTQPSTGAISSQLSSSGRVCLNEVQPGTILEIPIKEIHPSQMSVGHDEVNTQFSHRKQQTPQAFQKELDTNSFPAVIAPNGTVFISDGHHRATVGAVKESSEGASVQYKMKINITDNYIGSSWSRFGQEMVKQNKMYFTKSALNKLNQSLQNLTNEADTNRVWKLFFDHNLPSSFVALPDNPMRSVVAKIFHELNLPNIYTKKNFFEFRVSEILEEKLKALNIKLPSQLDSIKYKIKSLFSDPDVQKVMTDNISESLCKNTQRKQEPCKSLFLENLNNALGKSQVVHHLSPNNTAACPTLSSVMEMNGTALSNSPDAQKTLFIKAEMLRSDMDALCDRLAGHDNCVSLLKRKNMQDFIHGVIEKCNRKTYTQIKQMPDMARGRFNLDSMEQVENVVQALQEIGKEFGLHVKEVVPPRGQFVDVETKLPIPGMFSYPRYHVVLENDDGFQFEWQVGTKSATDILETNGIPILAGLQLPHGINNNLHDIGYDVFRSILTEAKSNREHAEVVSQVGLQEYVSQVDYTLAKAGLLGAKYTELHEDLKKLQHNAGQILEKIMRFKGPNFILKLFH